MDLGRLAAVVLCVLLVLDSDSFASGNMVFQVQHKFAGRERSLSEFKAHDDLRHGRILSDVQIPIGGNSSPLKSGLYFAKVGIGSPAKDYHVQVDTGSDILWVNCAGCTNCPTKSGLGIKLSLYDPKSSSSASLVTCEQDFCTATYSGRQLPGCRPNLLCEYNVAYGDGSTTSGYFVKDSFQFDRVSGDFQTTPMNGSVVFGCGSKQSGQLGSGAQAVDGILGFGQSNSSVISQLAAAGKVKKVFAHCLDGIKGGGIYAIGQVEQPKVNTTPMVPNQAHYNVNMKEIEVGGDVLQLPTDVFDTGARQGTIIDSGTTLAYFPKVVYEPLIRKILSRQPHLNLYLVEDQFQCFEYHQNIDDGFPPVTFHFEKSLKLTVYAHEYLFLFRPDVYCIGWMNGGMQKDGRDVTLLGDLALANKLVVYDIENQAIGWTEYDCSTSIKLKDESGVHSVRATDISSASSLQTRSILFSLMILIAMLQIFTS